MASDRLLAAVSENRLCRGIPLGDAKLQIPLDDAHRGLLKVQPCASWLAIWRASSACLRFRDIALDAEITGHLTAFIEIGEMTSAFQKGAPSLR